MKVLYFDIETAPLLAHVWHPFGDFVSQDQLIHDQFMLSWAAKWEHQKNVKSDVLNTHEARAQDDSRIVESLAQLIREADVIVAHNLDRFDLPVINKRLFLLGLDPLPPVMQIDTLKIARRSFKMEMNKLDFLADRLGLGRKIKTDFELWRRAYQGDSEALRKMVRYNKHDVVLLEQVFERMKPYAKKLPRLFEADGNYRACPFCGSNSVHSRGYYRTNAGRFRKVQCQDCQRYSRERVSDSDSKNQLTPI